MMRFLKLMPASVSLPPQIRLSGLWLLRTAGFSSGSRVRVTVLAPGKLLVEEVKP